MPKLRTQTTVPSSGNAHPTDTFVLVHIIKLKNTGHRRHMPHYIEFFGLTEGGPVHSIVNMSSLLLFYYMWRNFTHLFRHINSNSFGPILTQPSRYCKPLRFHSRYSFSIHSVAQERPSLLIKSSAPW